MEHARAIIADDERLGIERDDPALLRVANSRPQHAAPWLLGQTVYTKPAQVRNTYAAMDSVGLRAQVSLTYLRIGSEPFYPTLQPRDFVKALDVRRRLDLLLPCDTIAESKLVLHEYWRRFQCQFPGHAVFDMVPESEWPLMVPCRIHGDEGRRHSDWMGLWSCRLACLLLDTSSFAETR